MLKGFKIIDFNDVQPQLEVIHRNGWDSGSYVGFPQFERHYNMLLGSCTDWTGHPQSGKTEMLLELLMFTAETYGWVHMLWVPDIGKAVDVMIKLIHKHTGQTFKRQYDNFIDLKKAFESCAFLLHHFKILHREDRKVKLTPVQLWEYAALYKKTGKLHTCTIDSWKDMFHDYAAYGGSYAQYLSQVLPQRNDIAEESGLHFHTVVHPKNPQRDKNRKLYPPFPDDMEGGAQWNASGKCIIAVHRESWDSPVVDVYFRKIKPEQVGYATSKQVSLNFNKAISRYYWIGPVDNAWVYAEKKDGRYYQEYHRHKTVLPSAAPLDFTQPKKEEAETATQELPF